MSLFWKVYLPLAVCLIVTIIILGWVATRVIPAQIREFQRQTIEDFRDALLEERILSIPIAQAIADSLGIQVNFIPAGDLPGGRSPDQNTPGHVFFPATRSFPFVTEVSVFPENRRGARSLWSYLFLLLLVEGTVLYLSLRPLHKRVTRLTWTAEQFGSGNLGIRIPERAHGDQIDSLGRTFNKMSGRIEALVTSHQNLLGSVAHELRTPLARMGLALELIRDNPDSSAEKLDRMEKDLRCLDNLVSELLAFNRLSRLEKISGDDVDLSQLCSEVSQTETWGRPEVNISVTGTSVCRGDRTLLARAIGNLVRNAINHASSSVEIAVRAEGKKKFVTVSDDGPGFDPAILDHAGEPFVKGYDSKGAGLGLAIAARIAELHGGDLLFSNSRKGAVVTLSLPV